MKKVIFSGLLIAAVSAVSAQEITMYRVHNPNNPTTVTTIMNPAVVVVPQHINAQFVTRHPDVTVIEWEPMDTWWRASYLTDNRVTYVYYNDAGLDFNVALPVLHNSVPENVIATAIEQYGPDLYGLSTMKNAEGELIYQVHLIENGSSRMTWIDARGSEMTNVFRDSDDEDDAMTMNQ
jgi:hypothetical protein